MHLRIAHRPYPAVEWATGLDATSDGGPGWREYLDQIYQHVWAKDFWSKEIYLGVRLGQRSMRAQLTGGLFTQFFTTYRTAERTLGMEDEAVPAGEIGKWTEQAERLGRALTRQRARRAPRQLPRGGVAGTAHADGVTQRPAAVRGAAQEVGARRGRAAVRGPSAQRPDAAAA